MESRITPQSGFGGGIDALWQYRDLFYFFTWRDVKVKYRQTYLGIAWALVQPLLLTGVFSVLFGARMGAHTDIPYPVFAFSGLLLWNFFSTGLLAAANGMVSNSHIIQKVYFPRLIVPISSVLVSAVDFFVALPALAMLLACYRWPPRLASPAYFTAGLLLAVTTSIGGGSWLSALTVKYRDFRYVLPFLMQLLLFVTPVFYPIGYLGPTWARLLLALNPMSGAVTVFRAALSTAPIDGPLVALSGLSACVLLVGGLRYFRATEVYFADLT